MFEKDNVKEKEHKAVFGIFQNRGNVELAVSDLKASGFRNTDISVLLPSNDSTKAFAHEKGTKAPEGAATGATGGLAIGGVLGWLAGIGALAIPGVGPFVAAGPIVAAIAGAGIGGAVGGIAGALVGMGIPEYEAKRYESIIKTGGILVSVHVDDSDWQKRAKDILERNGARDIATSSEEKGNPPKNPPQGEYRPTM
ncbi:MAG: DUF3341 domain-containing protein [Bdellovibrionales bacterium]|nr:DUF3341 domain-containing protein [Bdellovibrionales bacterium]